MSGRYKMGDRVQWMRGAQLLTGYVVEVVPPGGRPAGWPGDNTVSWERYVVRSNGRRYFPHNTDFVSPEVA